MIQSLLIANRGDVACRIIRTAKQMGIKTIAVYSSCDAHSRHVMAADEAYWIGNSPASDSYLNADAILEAAKQANADAIHPGYGFLSESADFARQCLEAGFVFIGPKPELIALMADKKAAKEAVEALGLPVLADFRGTIPSNSADRKTLVERIGLPVLIKAAAGGGGKGMRLVKRLEELDQAIEEAAREAKAAFNNDSLMIERYLPNAKHIEVQVAGDLTGQAIHLFDRECSVQRRHQKLIEEAPSLCDDSLKEKLFADSIRLTHSIAYHTLGTIEFLVDEQNNHYFMEMNTRLQVEHPVTEMITGIDCVALQIRLACGEAMPYRQESITVSGHAIELRLCAENPQCSFLPSSGTLVQWSYPKNLPGLRIDTGFSAGDTITGYYDSMFAKWIVHQPTRPLALAALESSLNALCLRGLTTNRNYLACLIQDPDFQQGHYTTQLLANTLDRCLSRLSHLPEAVQLLMLAAHCLNREKASDWNKSDAWRIQSKHKSTLHWRINSMACTIHCRGSFEDGMEAKIGEHRYFFTARWEANNVICIDTHEHTLKAQVFTFGADIIITYQGLQYTLPFTIEQHSVGAHHSDTHLYAPMPGNIMSVAVAPGDTVQKGDTLITIEAMKMEHAIKAPRDATVVDVHGAVGEQTKEAALLIELS